MFECNPFFSMTHFQQCDRFLRSDPFLEMFSIFRSTTHLFQMWPILVRPIFSNFTHILQCGLLCYSVTYFLLGDPFFSGSYFPKFDPFYSEWVVFTNVTKFFYSVTNLSQINFFFNVRRFFQCDSFFKCITYFTMRPNFVNVTRFSKLTQFSKCDPFFTVWHN